MCVEYLLGTKAWYSSKSALIWKPKGTKYNRLYFQLSPSMHPTEGIESGLLPTAQASDPTTGSIISEDDTYYQTKTGMPRKVNRNGVDGTVGLGDLVQLLPTPEAQNQEGYQTNPQGIKYPRLGSAIGLKLQPNFVEWMMGFPQGWTDLNSPSPNIAKKGSKA